MNLVLVAIHIEASARAVPLGPAMLASVVKRAFPETVHTRILDLFLHQSAEACAAQILASEPDWVGFSIYVWNRTLIREVARIMRVRNPSILLFAGGSEATADPAGLLGEGFLDLVLPGEGEELIVEVLDSLLRGASPAEIRRTIRPAPVKDLGTLPSPWFAMVLDALGQTPSELFRRFADHLETHPGPDTTALQVAFFTSCFSGRKEAGVAADLVTYFGRSGALLEAAAPAPQGALENPRERLRTHTCLATFHHDPRALLEQLQAGSTDLEHLACVLPPHPCQALLHLDGGEILLQIVSPAEAEAFGRIRNASGPASEGEDALRFLEMVFLPGESRG